MRFKITLSYNGAPFCGWQIQPHAPSVQQSLNDALSTLLREDISVVGAGRTDTGVNAIDYVAHFDYDKSIDTTALKYKLNAILPPSIAIKGIEETDNDFHARFSARRREYIYHIHREKDPFAEQFSYQYSYPELDFDAMNEAAKELIGTKDETHWTFHIAADRFLRNMVRAIVGTLLEVGRGKRSPESISELLESGRRSNAGESVPGRALFLSKVEYFQ